MAQQDTPEVASEGTQAKEDASFTLRLSTDEMEAIVDVIPAQGGAAITREQLFHALAEKGIRGGIVAEALNQVLESSQTRTQSPPVTDVTDATDDDDATTDADVDAPQAAAPQSFVIARGQPPEAGQDSIFERLLPAIRDRQPTVTTTGRIDYREMGAIEIVHPGDALVLRHPPTPGIPGHTLLGAVVDARPGQELPFVAQLSGVEFSPDNPDLLIASITGQPVMIANGALVEPVLHLPAVDIASGNIEFEGSIHIAGDVSAGMTVKASGDIEIAGMVENASLEAGGSILVKGGVMGAIDHESGHEHRIRCTHEFHSIYAQKTRIEAGESIFIADMAMQCELIAGQHIKLGRGHKGHLLGGHAQATLSITAKVIGSPNRIRTICQIGIDPELAKQTKTLAAERSDYENRLLESSKLLAFAAKNPQRLNPQQLDRVRQTAATLSAEITRVRDKENALAAQIALAQNARVVAEEALYEGAEVHLGPLRYRVAHDIGGAQIILLNEVLDLVAL
ncbi:hypothetical protein AGMMS49960_15220 [Betaproteobacteria bacterium]|nr:hypothetical protein AGMMS49960_15220 [Betaproteobacteria bacterium]GHU16543.1 hypothetical protein AGMMS50243_02890 [Betaproteobacteria bacterium]